MPGGGATISRLLRPAASSTASAVPSLLASTKMISMATVGQHRLQALDQPDDVASLVLRRHDDREQGLLTEDPPRQRTPGDSRRGSRTDVVVFDCRADPPSPRRAKWGSDASPR